MEGHTIFKWYKLNSVIVDFLSQIYHEKMNELSGFVHLSKKNLGKYILTELCQHTISHVMRKPYFLHMRKQRYKLTAEQISAFVFSAQIVQSLFYL